jgi:hypothetical protein
MSSDETRSGQIQTARAMVAARLGDLQGNDDDSDECEALREADHVLLLMEERVLRKESRFSPGAGI